jgi:hypothetical protein
MRLFFFSCFFLFLKNANAAPKDSSCHIWMDAGLGLVHSRSYNMDVEYGMSLKYRNFITSGTIGCFATVMGHDNCYSFQLLTGPVLTYGIFMINAQSGLALLNFQNPDFYTGLTESRLIPGLPLRVRLYIIPTKWLAIGICGYFCLNITENLASANYQEAFGDIRNRRK